MTTYLAAIFLALTAPLILLFCGSEISYKRCGKRLQYPVLATLWFSCMLAYAHVGYVQVNLGCRNMLGDCYVDGISASFILWKDVLAFSYLGIMLLSGLHLIYQSGRWALGYLQRVIDKVGQSG